MKRKNHEEKSLAVKKIDLVTKIDLRIVLRITGFEVWSTTRINGAILQNFANRTIGDSSVDNSIASVSGTSFW